MKGQAPSVPSASSSSIVSGCPAPLAYLADLFLNLETHLSTIVSDAMTEEEERIKKSLVSKEPQWEDIGKDFSVTWEPKSMSFNYKIKGASKSKALALEYGPPAKSLLRHEIINVNKTMGKDINNKINKFLGNKK